MVGHQAQRRITGLLAQPFVDAVEEGIFQLRNRPAQRRSKFVLAVNQARQGGVFEVVAPIGGLIVEVFEGAAVQLLGARFGDHHDGAATRLRELRGRLRRLNMKLLHRIHGRIYGDGESVAVGIVGSVQQECVHHGAAAVDGRIERHRSARALLHVVIDVVDEAAELARNSARPERHQRHHVARFERQIGDAVVIHAVAERCIFRLHGRDGAIHGDALMRIAQGELDILARLLVDFEREAAGFEIAEAVFVRGDGIRAGRKALEGVVAMRVRDGLAHEARLLLRRGDRHSGYGRGRLIGYGSSEHRGSHLGMSGGAYEEQRQR